MAATPTIMLEIINKAILYTNILRNTPDNPYYMVNFAKMNKTRDGKYLLVFNGEKKVVCGGKGACLSKAHLDNVNVDWFTDGRYGAMYVFLLGDMSIALIGDDPRFMATLTDEERNYMNYYFDVLYLHFVERHGGVLPVKGLTLPEIAPIPKKRVLDPSVRIQWANKSVVREYNRNLEPASVAAGVNTMKNTKQGGRRSRSGAVRVTRKRRAAHN